MADFFQILQREDETKKAVEKTPVLNITKDEKEAMETVENSTPRKRSKKEKEDNENTLLTRTIGSPIWLHIAEAAKIGGVQTKTIRRAIKSPVPVIKFKIVANRYLVDLRSLIIYLHNNKKLQNKLNQNGIGQYVVKWKP